MENKTRMKNKYKKPTTLNCYAGSRYRFSLVVCSFIGCVLMFHLYFLNQSQHSQYAVMQMNSEHPYYRELVEVEDDGIKIPPPRKQSPRAIKRKPKRPTTLIEEFLDESSQLRYIFFPGQKTAIDPLNDAGNESLYYHTGRIWLDTDGNPIQAHGGGILYDDRSRTYYWYGEYKDGPTYYAHKKAAARVDIIGVGCYSSKDLWTWKNEGIVLAAEEANETHDLHTSNVSERPKVIYNKNTNKYVMWMHIDDANYTKASVGIAISNSPTGPFDYIRSTRPHGFESRDMTIFKDDDDVAYLVYSSEDNSELHIGPLTQDYLDVTNVMRRILVGQHREAPALFKHEGTYYMITSGCTGWAQTRPWPMQRNLLWAHGRRWGIHVLGLTKSFGLLRFSPEALLFFLYMGFQVFLYLWQTDGTLRI